MKHYKFYKTHIQTLTAFGACPLHSLASNPSFQKRNHIHRHIAQNMVTINHPPTRCRSVDFTSISAFSFQ